MDNTAQTSVYWDVQKRGYLEGYSAGQAAMRQVLKTMEELAELAAAIHPEPCDLALQTTLKAIENAGECAKFLFDYGQVDDVTIDWATFEQELPDVLVPLLVAAELADLDVIEAARLKAEADVVRGVR